MLNISQRAYAHYEAGTREIPIEILKKIADIYNVNLDYLVNRTNIKKKIWMYFIFFSSISYKHITVIFFTLFVFYAIKGNEKKGEFP